MKVTLLKTAVAHTALAAALVALPVIDSVARSTPKSTQAWWPASLDRGKIHRENHNRKKRSILSKQSTFQFTTVVSKCGLG